MEGLYYKGPLDYEEAKAVFTAVESVERREMNWKEIQDAIMNVSGRKRCRETCTAAMIIADEFRTMEPEAIKKIKEEDIKRILYRGGRYPITERKIFDFQHYYLTQLEKPEDEQDDGQVLIVVSETLYRLIGQWRKEIRYPHLKDMLEIWLRSLRPHQVLRQSMSDKRVGSVERRCSGSGRANYDSTLAIVVPDRLYLE